MYRILLTADRKPTDNGGRTIYSGPILDGKLVTETAQSAYNAGRAPKIPLIIGSNSAEVPAGFVNASSKDGLIKIYLAI
jgi:para-nitrobenzyl esterase